MANQSFANRVLMLQRSGDRKKLQNFYQKLALHLTKSPQLSYLLGHQVDEDDSEFGMCPCGHGEIIVTLNDNVYHPYQARPRLELACSNCRKNYQMEFRQVPSKGHFADPDLVVLCHSLTSEWPDYQAVIYPRFMWKLISIHGFR